MLAQRRQGCQWEPIINDGVLGTHVVLSELINGDLRFHEVVVEDDDLPAEGSLFLFMELRLQRRRIKKAGEKLGGKKTKEDNR